MDEKKIGANCKILFSDKFVLVDRNGIDNVKSIVWRYELQTEKEKKKNRMLFCNNNFYKSMQ